MTKSLFLRAYREKLSALPWASNPEKLERFMEACRSTIENETTSWNHGFESCLAAWHEIGGKGKPTLKALRALAE
jgi:hypothetical protein